MDSTNSWFAVGPNFSSCEELDMRRAKLGQWASRVQRGPVGSTGKAGPSSFSSLPTIRNESLCCFLFCFCICVPQLLWLCIIWELGASSGVRNICRFPSKILSTRGIHSDIVCFHNILWDLYVFDTGCHRGPSWGPPSGYLAEVRHRYKQLRIMLCHLIYAIRCPQNCHNDCWTHTTKHYETRVRTICQVS